MHGIDLIFGDEVEGWMACLASLLPSSSFLPWLILPLLLIIFFFAVILDFLSVYVSVGQETKRENERNACFVVSCSWRCFLSLFCSTLAEHFRGEEKWFWFLFYCLISCLAHIFFHTLNANHFLSWWYSKNHAPTMVFLSSLANLQEKSNFVAPKTPSKTLL